MDQSLPTVKATNEKKWIAVIICSIFLVFVALFWKEETLLASYRIIMISVCILLLLYAFCHAVYSTAMNDHGVTCSYFGKEYQSIRWEQVGKIVIARDYRLNLRTSGNTRIIVIPKGCPITNLKRLGAVPYIFQLHNQVIWLDDTEKNRQFIRKFWGELTDYR